MKYYQQLLIAIIAVAVLWSAEPAGREIHTSSSDHQARSMAASAVDVYLKPGIVKEARQDFEKRRQAYPFISLLPEDSRVPTSIR